MSPNSTTCKTVTIHGKENQEWEYRKEYMGWSRLGYLHKIKLIVNYSNHIHIKHVSCLSVKWSREQMVAGLLAYNQLVQNLAPHGYHTVTHTTGLWTHDASSTCFTLVVDNFGIWYEGKERSTYLTPWKSIIPYMLIGLELSFVDWHWNGPTINATSIFPCWGMCKKA